MAQQCFSQLRGAQSRIEEAMARSADTSETTKKARKSRANKVAPSESGKNVDPSELDRESLVQLEKDVERALRTYEERKRDQAFREMQAVAEKHGLSLKDLVGRTSGRTAQPSKYRHPENPALTWSGRGRQPDWFKEALEAGASRDDLLIA